jgi:anti-sigma B factor antagonist
MQRMNLDWQTWLQPGIPVAFLTPQEWKLKLNLEKRNRGNVAIVHCHGRIVYRDEAAAFSRFLAEILPHAKKLVLDLSEVTALDSAGIGELVLAQNRAQDGNVSLKFASPNTLVRSLLDLTNLDSVLDVYSSLDEALESLREERSALAVEQAGWMNRPAQ